MKIRIGFSRTAAEGAELTSDEADVREINIAVDDIGHDIARQVAAQCVAGYEKREQVGAAGVSQRGAFVVIKAISILLLQHLFKNLANARRSGVGGFLPAEGREVFELGSMPGHTVLLPKKIVLR